MKGFEFIDDHKGIFYIAVMCRVLGVSRNGYYDWVKRPPSFREIDDEVLTEKITQIHKDSKETYGYRGIADELNDNGEGVGEDRVYRLMRNASIKGLKRRKFHTTTKRDKRERPAPDLLNRDFSAEGPDKVYVADVTYVTSWAGVLFLAIVLDVYTRKVVGWATSSVQDASLVVKAMKMALARQKPDGSVIHHSDQGCQYTSRDFEKACDKAGVTISMGSVGDCYDNAMAESFFATLEFELLDRSVFENRHQALSAIFDYIERFYNPKRRHSKVRANGRSTAPNEFDRRWHQHEGRRRAAA